LFFFGAVKMELERHPKSGFMNSINNNIRLSIFVFQFSSAEGKRNSNSPNAFCFLFFSEKRI